MDYPFWFSKDNTVNILKYLSNIYGIQKVSILDIYVESSLTDHPDGSLKEQKNRIRRKTN